jgi:hypothetical protein
MFLETQKTFRSTASETRYRLEFSGIHPMNRLWESQAQVVEVHKKEARSRVAELPMNRHLT